MVIRDIGVPFSFFSHLCQVLKSELCWLCMMPLELLPLPLFF